MVDSRWLGMIRGQTEKFLTDEARIERVTTAIDLAGDQRPQWDFVQNTDCRLLPMQTRDTRGEVAEREAIQTRYRLIVPVGTNIREGDRIKVNNLRYEMIELKSVPTDRAFIEVVVTRISGND